MAQHGERNGVGIRRAPSTSLGISPAGSNARKTAQLRLALPFRRRNPPSVLALRFDLTLRTQDSLISIALLHHAEKVPELFILFQRHQRALKTKFTPGDKMLEKFQSFSARVVGQFEFPQLFKFDKNSYPLSS